VSATQLAFDPHRAGSGDIKKEECLLGGRIKALLYTVLHPNSFHPSYRNAPT
jgi:hypothetical protein